jgi:hypothetical protein
MGGRGVGESGSGRHSWVLRSCGTLVLGLATVCCDLALSCPQALFFWHVNSIMKEHTFHAVCAFLSISSGL